MSTPGKSWQCLITPGATAALRFWWAVTVLFPFSSKQRLGASEQASFVYAAVHGGVWEFEVQRTDIADFHLFEVVLQFQHLGKNLASNVRSRWCFLWCQKALWEWIPASNLTQYQEEPFLGTLLHHPNKEETQQDQHQNFQVWSSFCGYDIPRKAINRNDWTRMSQDVSWAVKGKERFPFIGFESMVTWVLP